MAELRRPSNINAERKDLKTEFLLIGERRKGEHLTQIVMEELYYEYSELFKLFDMSELNFNLAQTNNGEIEFTPIRTIDKLAIRGIITL